MGRPRNKIAALPLEMRQIVLAGLIDGHTYDAIRLELIEAGVAMTAIPSNNAFGAYRHGDEYKAQESAMQNWKRRAEEKKQFWQAVLAGGGAAGLANITGFEAIEALRASLGRCETPAEQARVASVLANLIRTMQDDARETYRRECEARKEAAAKELAQSAKPSDPAAVGQVLDKLLGVKAA